MRYEMPAVAVVLRPRTELDRRQLADRVTRELDERSRPIVVRIVDDIPMTAGYRFRKQALRAAGIGDSDFGERTLWYDRAKHAYFPLDAAGLKRLRKSLAPTPGRRKTQAARRNKPRSRSARTARK
jgi:putative long chain acyl-CoA synthase